jgi:hypothetical protein
MDYYEIERKLKNIVSEFQELPKAQRHSLGKNMFTPNIVGYVLSPIDSRGVEISYGWSSWTEQYQIGVSVHNTITKEIISNLSHCFSQGEIDDIQEYIESL